jgi:hypothetical protein
MSLVDRWLAQPVATSATSATSPKTASISANPDVAIRSRHPATSTPPTINSPSLSQTAAPDLRQEISQNLVASEALSQMSQMSQGATAQSSEEVAAPAERTPAIGADGKKERVAIAEHDGKIPRAWADGYARLDPDRPPGDVPRARWRRFVDDVGLFLDSPFCAVAEALGWSPYDLFGCDRDRPFARIDQMGLLWLLNGNRVVMLTEDAATIEIPDGIRQTYKREAAGPGQVLVWELASD